MACTHSKRAIEILEETKGLLQKQAEIGLVGPMLVPCMMLEIEADAFRRAGLISKVKAEEYISLARSNLSPKREKVYRKRRRSW